MHKLIFYCYNNDLNKSKRNLQSVYFFSCFYRVDLYNMGINVLNNRTSVLITFQPLLVIFDWRFELLYFNSSFSQAFRSKKLVFIVLNAFTFKCTCKHTYIFLIKKERILKVFLTRQKTISINNVITPK